jgi:DNA-nicking Smr family endonuclease
MSHAALPSDEDQLAWQQATADVAPLRPDGRAVPQMPQPKPRRLRLAAQEAENDARHLKGLLPSFDEDDSGAFARSGCKRLLADLKRGRIAPAAALDLHGFTQDEAEAALLRFIARACDAGLRAVRVIHGQGHSSPGGVAVLKARCRLCLSRHPAVLAFASARPEGGGPGATDVALGRKR